MTPEPERTTPTGIPVRPCHVCGCTHPITRRHCTQCGTASLFLRPNGLCLDCAERQERQEARE